MKIGAHVSIAGGISKAVERQVDIGGTCGQIFTHSPQTWRQPEIELEEGRAFREETAEYLEGPWVIHASYLVNLATPKEKLREKSIRSMQRDLEAAALLGIPYVNVHLGAHTGAGEERGLENAARALDQLQVPDGVHILVESDAGSGTKLGDRFEHLAEVLRLSDQELFVCIDTAHVFVAGYDLATPDAVNKTIRTFDEVVGLENLKAIHLNDAKRGCGTHIDRHAHIGEGQIGEAGMRRIINHPALRELPYVLETPNGKEKGHAWNVARVKALRNAPA